MPVCTMLISGPPGGGKTTVACLIGDKVLERRVHHLRMRPAVDGHTNAVLAAEPAAGVGPRPGVPAQGWASAHTVCYTPERLFEILPEGLRAVRAIDRCAFAIIEADGDPALRHAYPYDFRVFVMPAPATVPSVFRTLQAAAVALHQVLQDTAAFASEIFGLFDAAGLDDTIGVHHYKPATRQAREPPVEQLDIAESQIRHFLGSPLGAEIASRIQLQPEYHALVEADIVLINTGVGGCDETLDDCVKRLEKLLSRVRQETRRHSVLYWGDILNTRDPTYAKLLRRLRTLLAGEP